jgi:hypothetical protein
MLPALVLAACNPYDREGDYYAGAIDPGLFPSAYVGVGFDPQAMQGEIKPAPASTAVDNVGDVGVGYFAFPVPDGVDPLTLKQIVNNIPQDKPLVYVFDGDPSKDTTKCTAPKDYVYDERTDFVRFDHQGNIFQQRQVTTGPRRDPSALPSDPGYVPIYAEVPVNSDGEDCQGVKSAEGIVSSNHVDFPNGKDSAPPGVNTKPVGLADGKYIAMAIVDPAALVWSPVPDGNGSITLALDPNTMLGPQRFGFYDHYLVAYIEGGYVPNTTIAAADGTTMSVIAKPMSLYLSNTQFDKNKQNNPTIIYNPSAPLSDGNTPIAAIALRLPGVIVGSDGKSGRRGDPGYSPICQVHTYKPVGSTYATSISQITPLSVDPENNGSTFIYCLQVAQ